VTASPTGSPIADIDPFDVGIACSATGLLRSFNQVGILSAADVHVAVRLGELAGEPDEQVRLALALAVRGVRGGSVCVDLREVPRIDPGLDWPEVTQWLGRVRASPLVGPGRPLRWDLELLYLDRYWRQEDQVRADLVAREAQLPPSVDPDLLRSSLDRLFGPDPDGDHTDQRRAAEIATRRWTTVLGGGPGTGKTTTVARLLAVLHEQHGPGLRVALAAPTGKAAARLQEAVRDVVGTDFAALDRDRLGTITASTLHRLLGSRPGEGTRFRHDRDNRLPHDVVVVDETSMLSLTLMARLLEALRPDTRLVLVGDPDQLASVEAGAVLADLVAGLSARELAPQAVPPVVVLTHTWRFGSAIGDLAGRVRAGDADGAVAVLRRGEPALDLTAPDLEISQAQIRDDVVRAATAIRVAAKVGDARGALDHLDKHRVLCAHRTGPFGVQAWSRKIERWLSEVPGDPREGEWYVGRPLLMTVNDYALGLFNGDTGVVVRLGDGSIRAVFARGNELVDFAPSRLADVETVHAMTVHRSQGSQFERVTVVLPPADSPLATREMLYTALTRAQQHVRLVGTETALRAAIERPAARASGLRLRLSRDSGQSGEHNPAAGQDV
jgi:exodeoxyribonuclease V alpha subunit